MFILAAAKLHGRALKYPTRLIDEESQAPTFVIEAQAEPARILCDSLFAAGREAAVAQSFQHLSGSEAEIISDERCIEADVACAELRKVYGTHTSSYPASRRMSYLSHISAPRGSLAIATDMM